MRSYQLSVEPEIREEPQGHQVEYAFSCPYCWESISMLLDTSVAGQTFIEDCENCCHPIEIAYAVEEGAIAQFLCEKAQ